MGLHSQPTQEEEEQGVHDLVFVRRLLDEVAWHVWLTHICILCILNCILSRLKPYDITKASFS